MKAKDIEVGEVYAVGSSRWPKRARVTGIIRARRTPGYMLDHRHDDYIGNGYRRDEQHGRPVAMVVYLDHMSDREQPIALTEVREPWADHEAAQQIARELAAEQQERREERLRGLVERIQRCVGVELANTAASRGRLDRASFTLDDLATFVEAVLESSDVRALVTDGHNMRLTLGAIESAYQHHDEDDLEGHIDSIPTRCHEWEKRARRLNVDWWNR